MSTVTIVITVPTFSVFIFPYDAHINLIPKKISQTNHMWCIRSKNTFGLVGLRTNESSDYWTVTNSIGNESRNIDDLYFWISILYQSHKAIEIRKIFIWFRMPHKKCENLMISYVFKKNSFQLSVSIYWYHQCQRLLQVEWVSIHNWSDVYRLVWCDR